jgi:transcriptional regulator with XRE-family HTH domain
MHKMKNSYLSARVKELRNQKGISQNTLAEESALSLRTIQRIENGETNPTGDSLKQLSSALNVNLDELVDWSIKEDKRYLIFLNLSALTFIFFPLLGILVPFILWTSRKNKIKNINKLGTDLINFEIIWTMILFFIPFLLFLFTKTGLLESLTFDIIFTFTGIMYGINLILILLNTLRISNEKNAIYYPLIKLLRE